MGRRRLHVLQGPWSVAPRPPTLRNMLPSAAVGASVMLHHGLCEAARVDIVVRLHVRRMSYVGHVRLVYEDSQPFWQTKLRWCTIFANAHKRQVHTMCTAQMRMPCEFMREHILDTSPGFGVVRGDELQPKQSETHSAASRASFTE